MTQTAVQILEDSQNHPENHLHNFNELISCCTVDGVLDISLFDTHAEHIGLGTNGGAKCDVLEGPCACGAWHTKEEMQKRMTNRQK